MTETDRVPIVEILALHVACAIYAMRGGDQTTNREVSLIVSSFHADEVYFCILLLCAMCMACCSGMTLSLLPSSVVALKLRTYYCPHILSALRLVRAISKFEGYV